MHAAEVDDDDTNNNNSGDGGEGEGTASDESATIERALDALVDPAVKMCVAAAEEKDAVWRRQQQRATDSSLTAAAAAAMTWDRPVFVLNCLTYLVDTLAPHACATRKRAELDGAVEARVLELIEDHVRLHSLSLSLSLSPPMI